MDIAKCAALWRRILSWGGLCIAGAAIWALVLADPLIRLWRAVFGA